MDELFAAALLLKVSTAGPKGSPTGLPDQPADVGFRCAHVDDVAQHITFATSESGQPETAPSAGTESARPPAPDKAVSKHPIENRAKGRHRQRFGCSLHDRRNTPVGDVDKSAVVRRASAPAGGRSAKKVRKFLDTTQPLLACRDLQLCSSRLPANCGRPQ
jgi:hypothetical protein